MTSLAQGMAGLALVFALAQLCATQIGAGLAFALGQGLATAIALAALGHPVAGLALAGVAFALPRTVRTVMRRTGIDPHADAPRFRQAVVLGGAVLALLAIGSGRLGLPLAAVLAGVVQVCTHHHVVTRAVGLVSVQNGAVLAVALDPLAPWPVLAAAVLPVLPSLVLMSAVLHLPRQGKR